MYRDALEAAHKRITELESRLAGSSRASVDRERAGKGRTPSSKRGVLHALALIASVFAILGFGTYVVARFSMVHAPVRMPASPIAPSPIALSHDWNDALLTPFAVDVDNDGVEDVVASFRETTKSDGYVRAVSGRTFAPLWTSGPFDSPSKVAVVGNRVVVMTAGFAKILDLATGLVTKSIKTSMKSACAAVGKPNVALLPPDSAIDVQTGAISAPIPNDRCDWSGPNTCEVANEPCLLISDPVHATKHKVHGWTTLVDGRYRVSYGWVLPSTNQMVAAGSMIKKEAAWERDATLEGEAIVPIEHTVNYQSMMVALDGDRFVIAYGIATGTRIVARDAATGEIRWTAFISEHPRNAALRSTAQRIYLQADWHIYVVDGATGRVLGTI